MTAVADHLQVIRGGAPLTFARGDHVELAQRLAAVCDARGKTVHAEGAFYTYDAYSGLWKRLPEEALSCDVQGFAGIPVEGRDKPLKLRAGDVAGVIKLASDRITEPEFFAGATAGIAFANGFVRVNAASIEFVEHTERHRARHGYEFEYDTASKAERWLSFLSEVFAGDDDAAAKIACLQEFGGAALLGIGPRFQKALLMLGDGANGKSKTIQIVAACFPPDSVVAIPPQDWAQEYRRALLAGKRLNCVSELPEADIFESEPIKAIIDGSPITGRRIHEAPFTLRPVASHVFAANRLPGTNDSTHGFWRRFIILKFNRTFAEHEQNERVAEQIIAAELPGIVAWLLEGAGRLLAQAGFTVPPSCAAEVNDWRATADQVRLFIAEGCRGTTTPDERTPAERLYRAYRLWAERNGHKPLASNKFGARMKLSGKASEHTKTGNVYPVALTANDSDNAEERRW